MRVVFYVALAIAVVTSNNVVAATNEAHLSSKTTPDFVAVDSTDSHKRFLRVHREQDEDLTSLVAEDEERGKGLENVAKELKVRNQSFKKLSATAKKMEGTSHNAAADLDSVLAERFLGFYIKNQSPDKVKRLGLLKLAQLEKYENFWKSKMEA